MIAFKLCFLVSVSRYKANSYSFTKKADVPTHLLFKSGPCKLCKKCVFDLENITHTKHKKKVFEQENTQDKETVFEQEGEIDMLD
jgi:hypothetical protein